MYYDHEGNALEEYSKAPLEVLHDKELKDFSKLLYFEMYSLYDQNKEVNDYVFTKDETLAKKMSVSVSTVEKALRDLEQQKYIQRLTSKYSKKKEARKRLIHLCPLKKNDDDNISYATFPKTLYTANNLTGTAKLLLIELLSLGDIYDNEQLGQIEISNQTLADRFNKTRRTIINGINRLKDNKYISIRKVSANKRYVYLENEKIWFESYWEFEMYY